MRRVLRGILIIAVFVIVGLCVRTWGVSAVRIAGTSMTDTLMDGDIVLFTRFDYAFGGGPSRGDVVECTFPNRSDTYVKRVIGLPGDTIAFSEGALSVNGQAVSEPYVSTPTEDYQVLLGDGEYLVLGDNRQESYDSRAEDMGAIGRTDFLGRARLIIWPLSRFGWVD